MLRDVGIRTEHQCNLTNYKLEKYRDISSRDQNYKFKSPIIQIYLPLLTFFIVDNNNTTKLLMPN